MLDGRHALHGRRRGARRVPTRATPRPLFGRFCEGTPLLTRHLRHLDTGAYPSKDAPPSGGSGISREIVEAAWFSWGLFFDPGTQTGIMPDDKLSAKLVALIFSVIGFVFNLVVLGLIVDKVTSDDSSISC